jgi:hypothetical protein
MRTEVTRRVSNRLKTRSILEERILTNANRSRNSEPSREVHATRDAQQPASEHGQTDEPNGAERMPRNGVEADGQGDVRRSADQAQVEPVSYQGQ